MPLLHFGQNTLHLLHSSTQCSQCASNKLCCTSQTQSFASLHKPSVLSHKSNSTLQFFQCGNKSTLWCSRASICLPGIRDQQARGAYVRNPRKCVAKRKGQLHKVKCMEGPVKIKSLGHFGALKWHSNMSQHALTLDMFWQFLTSMQLSA